MRIGLTLAAALVAGVPAQAQTLTLEHGGAATLSADGSGGFTIAEQTTDAEWLEPDRVFLSHMRTAQPDADNMVAPPNTNVPPVPVTADRLTIRFLTNSRESVLSLQNGFDQGVVYRARMWVRGQAQPTDVCLVYPNGRIYEYWPYVIERIELTGFTFQPWSRGDPVPCA